MNDWVLESLKKKGITKNADGTLNVTFFGNKVQIVKDIAAAIRQQEHIVTQQIVEQSENTTFGILMRNFHDAVLALSKMTRKEWTEGKYKSFTKKMNDVLEIMSMKREDLRVDGYLRLCKVMDMVRKNNLPAANLASQAALERMRRRWMVNARIIDKSYSRLAALKSLKQ
jgi:hypothetical protein